MHSEQWKKLEELCSKALELNEEDRQAFLDENCSEDHELKVQLEKMLASYQNDPSFLEEAIVDLADLGPIEDDLIDQVVGDYKIIRPLGDGGMGKVYLAKRSDGQFKKFVAIKIVKKGMDSEEIIQRFNMERQILASLDHPNIARLLDGGITQEHEASTGRSYFVMQFVEGKTIVEYCDEKQFSIQKRLDLFIKVCDAVHYAHQNLIVHRDLKPSNILVTKQGEPVLLDFGIAKLLNRDLVSGALPVTRTEMRMMTPEYASPEQVKGGTITTASDVYALGVLMYELLSGHRPYKFKTKSALEIHRIICEVDPERPSTKVTKNEDVHRNGVTEFLSPLSIAESRDLTLDRLKRLLSGDLDNIVLMAMRKEAMRRYASAEQLADDIRHFLADRPIIARSDSRVYRTSKFVKRHKVSVVAAAFAILSLIAGLSVSIWQWQSATRAQDLAEAEQARSEQTLGVISSIFERMNPRISGTSELNAEELLDWGAKYSRQELKEQPELQAEVLHRLGEIYSLAWKLDKGEELLRMSLEIRERLHGRNHPDVALSLNAIGRIYRFRHDNDEARDFIEEAISIQELTLAPMHDDFRTTLFEMAEVDRQSRRLGSAANHFDRMMEVALANHPKDHENVLSILEYQGRVRRDMGELETSISSFSEGSQSAVRLFGAKSAWFSRFKSHLGQTYALQQDWAQSEAAFEAAIDVAKAINDTLIYSEALGGLSLQYLQQGAFEDAIPVQKETLALRERIFGHDELRAFRSKLDLGMSLAMIGRFEESREALISFEQLSQEVGPFNTFFLNFWIAYGLDQEGRHGEARDYLSRFDLEKINPRHGAKRFDFALEPIAQIYESWDRQQEADLVRGFRHGGVER